MYCAPQGLIWIRGPVGCQPHGESFHSPPPVDTAFRTRCCLPLVSGLTNLARCQSQGGSPCDVSKALTRFTQVMCCRSSCVCLDSSSHSLSLSTRKHCVGFLFLASTGIVSRSCAALLNDTATVCPRPPTYREVVASSHRHHHLRGSIIAAFFALAGIGLLTSCTMTVFYIFGAGGYAYRVIFVVPIATWLIRCRFCYSRTASAYLSTGTAS